MNPHRDLAFSFFAPLIETVQREYCNGVALQEGLLGGSSVIRNVFFTSTTVLSVFPKSLEEKLWCVAI
jgi:hypothetical protein